jgi:hypothetical protein
MAGIAFPNLPSYSLNATSVTARQGETPNADWDGGLNRGGGNNMGVGINTGDVNPKAQDWSLNDQNGAARDPQNSQHIGGSGLDDGDQVTNAVRAIQSGDVNDTLAFVTANQTAEDGEVADTVTGTVNRTGKQVTAGQNLWGTIPVA